MDKDREIASQHLDLLKEIGTIGAGRAATALAEMLNCRVDITLPETKIVPLESLDKILGNPEDLYFVLDTGVEGNIKGRMFFLLSPQEAKILAGNVLNKNAQEIDIGDPLFQSVLKEVVNILSGGYINAFAEMANTRITYTIPSLAMDMVAAILDFIFIQIAENAEEAIFIKTNLKIKDILFEGLFLFFPDLDSLKKLFEILGIEDS